MLYNRILSDDNIRALAPSVFAPAPHVSRSDRYAYISTAEVLDGLRKAGFEPFSAQEAKVRDASREGYAKHILRLRHADLFGDARLDAIPEIVITNSHDGSSAYKVMAGAFRFICTNGLIIGENYGELRVPHKGDVVGRVIDASYEVLDISNNALEAAIDWQGIELEKDEQLALAEAARVVRFSDAEGNVSTPITADMLLHARRASDHGRNDLWHVFNRVQENVIKGGLSAYDRQRHRRRTARAVEGIDQNVRLNRALWTLAERMAELKGA